MLSGLTSQLGGLIGGKKTQQPPPDEGATTTAEEDNSNAAAAATPSQEEPTPNTENRGDSVLSSVRNHIPSWLGGGKSSPKEEIAAGVETVEGGKGEEEGKITPDKGSDASSATGGADSDNQRKKLQKVSEDEAEAGAGGNAGLEKLKNFGTSIFSTIKGAGQKIKETQSILGEFQREHESFLKSKGGKGEAVAPWVGHPKEEALKEEILSLSTDRRNFVRSPPTGVLFQWDYEEMAPIAKAILKDDPNLEDMRYQLVPKVISEENFWRNYFYRVSLLKESMSDDEPKKKRDSIDTDEEDAALEQELNEELKSFEVVGGGGKVDEKELDSLLDLK